MGKLITPLGYLKEVAHLHPEYQLHQQKQQ